MLTTATQTENEKRYHLPLGLCCVHGDDTDNPRKTYHYENPSYPNHLTGITDENNVRVVTYSYDVQGRVNYRSLAGDVLKIDLEYLPDGSTKTIDHNEVERIYRYATILGEPRLTEIAGPPCLACGDRYRKIDYNANGYRTRTQDFNGNVTTYAYNTRNLQTSRTEAVGTPAERTITTDWHATYRLPVRITEPGRVTTLGTKGTLLT